MMHSKFFLIITVFFAGVLSLISCDRSRPNPSSAPENGLKEQIENLLKKEIQKNPNILIEIRKKSKWAGVPVEEFVGKAAAILADYRDDKCFYRSRKEAGKATSEGHRQITQTALAAFECFKKGKDALEIVKESNVATDDYYWSVPAAHAQTPDDIKLQDKGGLDKAQKDYCAWINNQLDKAREAIKSAKKEDGYIEALRYFGFSLHAIQDLEYHNGMNNPEHSFYSFWTWAEDDPDTQTDVKAGVSQKASRLHWERFVFLVKKDFGEDTVNKLTNFITNFKGKYEKPDIESTRGVGDLVAFFVAGFSYNRADWMRKNPDGTSQYSPPRWKDKDGNYSPLLKLNGDDGKTYDARIKEYK